MGRAGHIAIKRHYESFSSISTVSKRWNQFVDYVKDRGIRRMEHIEVEHIREYGQTLVDKGYSPASQQNYISAVNIVLEEARGDREVRINPTEVAESRILVASQNLSTPKHEHEHVIEVLDHRVATLLELQRSFGLRFEESAKLDAKTALEQAKQNNTITIEYGTKGGQKREITLSHDYQIEVLANAAEIQQDDRSMIPGKQTYIEFKHEAYNEIRNLEINFHGERHAYAQKRYLEITNHIAPIEDQDREERWIPHLAKQLGIEERQARELDSAARLQISKELGHHREDVVSAYLGGKG
ncbi:integrase domain-containing protein [Hydrogenovibrio sp. 3SP14C1]|uniref:integrase domain-containing protein n=1 Tax=Hydrogenovibrio sp. 3SP14C1 TaxID=3038774 RepID=UPI002416D2EA|nr:integrase domain-containing protein [Hydrogenovibrio sp. 3SP14C1]MDG4813189.1 integrase domain-containing protein [Hydrogenovibrio sp. 3SP14C1]